MLKPLLAGFLLALTTSASAALPDPYPRTYWPIAANPVLIRNTIILTGDGERLDDTDLLLVDGKITAIGKGISAPENATIVDGRGHWVTPGIIDVHSHLGVYASPG